MAVEILTIEHGIVQLQRGAAIHTYDNVIDVIDEHGETVGVFSLGAISGAYVGATAEEPTVAYDSVADLPRDGSIFYDNEGDSWWWTGQTFRYSIAAEDGKEYSVSDLDDLDVYSYLAPWTSA